MAWKDLMRKLAIGGKNKNFTKDNLPKNRRQVFKFVYKNRALQLFSASMLCLLFALPFLFWEVLNFIVKIGITEKTALEEGLTLFEKNLQFITTANLIKIPCVMIASLGLAGLLYVVRKLAWDETVSVGKDFFKGIKNSWGQFLIIGLILALNIYLSEVLFNIFLNSNTFSGGVNLGLSIVVILLDLALLIMYCYAFNLSALYNTNIIQIFKAAFILTYKKFFTNIWMLIVGLLPVAIWFMLPFPIYFNPLPILYMIGVLLLVFGGIGYSSLVILLFVMRQFDKFINEKNYPEMVNKGIYTGEETQEDDLDNVSYDDIEQLAEQLAQDYEEESNE